MMGVIQATMLTLSESINDDQQRWNGSQQETEHIQGAENHYPLISLPQCSDPFHDLVADTWRLNRNQ